MDESWEFNPKAKTHHGASIITHDRNLQAFLYILLAVFPFKNGISIWREFCKSKEPQNVHPQFLINYIIQPVNTIIRFAEKHIISTFFDDNKTKSLNNIKKKINGHLRTLLTIEYLKFYVSTEKASDNMNWANESIKNECMAMLQPTAIFVPGSKTDFKVTRINKVDSIIKLTMLRYPKYMQMMINEKSKPHK